MAITFLDIEGLPAPEIIEELDYEVILAAMVADIKARLPDIAATVDLESEPVRKLFEVAAYRELVLRARINDAIRANLVAFARSSDLDHLASFYDVIRLSGESDDAFRKRVILAIAGRSTGGTEPRYRSVALGASTEVKDAIAYRDGVSPVVNVAIFSTAPGGAADAALLNTVSQALNDPAVRMVNDTINVLSAVTTTVNVTADVWLLPDTPYSVFEALEGNLRADFEAEGGLGFDVTVSWLTARLMRPGVQKVSITAPVADVAVTSRTAAQLGTVTLVYKGRAK